MKNGGTKHECKTKTRYLKEKKKNNNNNNNNNKK